MSLAQCRGDHHNGHMDLFRALGHWTELLVKQTDYYFGFPASLRNLALMNPPPPLRPPIPPAWALLGACSALHSWRIRSAWSSGSNELSRSFTSSFSCVPWSWPSTWSLSHLVCWRHHSSLLSPPGLTQSSPTVLSKKCLRLSHCREATCQQLQWFPATVDIYCPMSDLMGGWWEQWVFWVGTDLQKSLTCHSLAPS